MEIDYLCSGKQDSSGLSLLKTGSAPYTKKRLPCEQSFYFFEI